MEKRTLILITGLVMMVFVAGCERKETEPQQPVLEFDEAVAAYINGEPLSLAEVRLEAFAQGVITPGEEIAPDHPEFDRLLEQLIDQRLLAQEALAKGLDQASDARYRLTIARERILRDLLAESLVEEADIERMYAAQAELQQLDDEVRVSQIMTESRDAAEEVRVKLLEGGDFAALAFEYSVDSQSRINGGLLGYVAPNEMPDPFSSIIANTKVGNVSRVFESENGWHVLRVEDRRQAAPLTLAEMRPRIIEFLIKEQLRDTIDGLRANAVIRTPDELELTQDADTEGQ
ncbi:MAG: peptidylprolyl isomerase [Pseudomonadota bacterium]